MHDWLSTPRLTDSTVRQEAHEVFASNLEEIKQLARGAHRAYLNGLLLHTGADYLEDEIAMIQPGDLIVFAYDEADDVVTKLGEIAEKQESDPNQ